MSWFKTGEVAMPKDRDFQIYIGDCIGLCEWSVRDEVFSCVWEPAYAWAIREVDEKLMKRITHWREMPDKPLKSDDVI